MRRLFLISMTVETGARVESYTVDELINCGEDCSKVMMEGRFFIFSPTSHINEVLLFRSKPSRQNSKVLYCWEVRRGNIGKQKNKSEEKVVGF